jgi:hypothetical protein
MGHLSLRDSMKGTRREGSFTGDPKRYVKALEMGIFFRRGPEFGEHGVTIFIRAFKRKNLLRGIFVQVLRHVKMPCKWESLSTWTLLGNLDGVRLPGLMREKKKYIWVPFLEPGSIKILSMGAICNVSKGTGRNIRLWVTNGLSIRPRCIGSKKARIHFQSISQSSMSSLYAVFIKHDPAQQPLFNHHIKV